MRGIGALFASLITAGCGGGRAITHAPAATSSAEVPPTEAPPSTPAGVCVDAAFRLGSAPLPALGGRASLRVVEGMVPARCMFGEQMQTRIGDRVSCFALDVGDGIDEHGMRTYRPGEPPGLFLEVFRRAETAGDEFEATTRAQFADADRIVTGQSAGGSQYVIALSNAPFWDREIGWRGGHFLGVASVRDPFGRLLTVRLSSVRFFEDPAPAADACGAMFEAIVASLDVTAAEPAPSEVTLGSLHIPVPAGFVVDRIEDLQRVERQVVLTEEHAMRDESLWGVAFERVPAEVTMLGSDGERAGTGQFLGQRITWTERAGTGSRSVRSVEVRGARQGADYVMITVSRGGAAEAMDAQWTRAQAIVAGVTGTLD